MGLRTILQDGDPSLLKKSRVVTDFNRRLHILLDDMRETLLDANGLGLAAPQVGVLRRAVLIVDMSIDSECPNDQIIELINPEITEVFGEQSGQEGCLSIPGVYCIVRRPQELIVRAQDRHGNHFKLLCKDMAARAVCHEIDHLNGVLFTTIADRFMTDEELNSVAAEQDD